MKKFWLVFSITLILLFWGWGKKVVPPNEKITPPIIVQKAPIRKTASKAPATVWKNEVKEQLLKFQEKETKITISGPPENSLVTYILESGRRSSFRAQIDPKSGRILRTWGRPIQENKKSAVRIKPSGTLPKMNL